MRDVIREQRLAEVFVELADSLIDDFDVIEFLQTLCARCVELLDVSAAGVLLADQYGELQTIAASDEHTRLLELFAVQHDMGPCVVCFRDGESLTNIDLHSPEANTAWPAFAAHARAAGFGIAHAVPLRLRTRVIGAMNLFRTGGARLGESDAALAQALADVATIAVLQQRTLEQSQVEAAQLQAALDSRVVIEQVKGILAERWQVSVDEAFAVLRRHVRARRLPLAEFARQIVSGEVDTGEIQRG